jgi:hypothetical protein
MTAEGNNPLGISSGIGKDNIKLKLEYLGL